MGIAGFSVEKLIEKVMHNERKPRPLPAGIMQIGLNQYELVAETHPSMTQTVSAAPLNPEAV
jgi:hypothetical protein